MAQKRLQVIVAVVLVTLAVAAAGKNIVAKTAVVGGVKAMTGLDLKIGSMSVGLINTAVRIRRLMLENPAGFTDRVMIDLPEIYVNYDLGAFLGQKVHLREVRLNLNEFLVVRNPQGEVNVEALKVVQESKGGPAHAQKKAEAAKAPAIQIDVLQLKIGKVVFKDYTGGGAPKVQEFPLNLDERYTHITNPQMFAGLVVSRALMNTTVGRLTGVNLTALQSQVNTQLKEAMRGALETAAGLTDGVKIGAQGAAHVGKDALDTAGDTVKQTADAIKKALPFGN